ncbi:MAG: HD domain-containing protein [Saprospiraceae bacterium]|nr:HD domain-containing protein [Saprospiraceae bacterium]MBK9723053.1 HD domain-containing protein [Saprospiraceae bacterium]
MSFRKLKLFLITKLKSDLPANLTYHGLHHTMEVLAVCNQYIKRLNINKQDARLLRTAALIHDIGIIWQYFGHEEAAVEYAYEILPNFDYSMDEIKIIDGIIMATKIPQQPKTILEMILCDADLDYLGTNKFFSTGDTLYEEFLAYNVVQDEVGWNQLQIKFLSNHSYHTEFAIKNREPKKKKYLKELMLKWN